MMGVDWPGRSAVHSAWLTSIRSGRFFSFDVPFWFGPRQLNQPLTGAPADAETAANRQINSRIEVPETRHGLRRFVESESAGGSCAGRQARGVRARADRGVFIVSGVVRGIGG